MPEIDREARRKGLQCTVHPLNSLADYVFVVVCAFHEDRMLLSRHARRSTWETQGGHIEPGETPLETARRELYEESGVTEAEVIPLCDYYGYDEGGHANGVVFLAHVKELGSLPPFEMKEVRLFDALPDNLTYPHVTPTLFAVARIAHMEERLNRALHAVKAPAQADHALLKEDMARLSAYYGSADWFVDRERDSRGELPHDLPRGVLTEDAVYDLLTDYDRLVTGLP